MSGFGETHMAGDSTGTLLLLSLSLSNKKHTHNSGRMATA